MTSGRKQTNFDATPDVREWIDRVTPGFRNRAINQALREASAKGKEWLIGIYCGEASHTTEKLGNDSKG